MEKHQDIGDGSEAFDFVCLGRAAANICAMKANQMMNFIKLYRDKNFLKTVSRNNN